MKSKRLYFIDAVRAFAILMMLQGHFIDTLLLNEYKDKSYVAFEVWSYFRGITAPTFFTISGLIFTFLLLKAKAKQEDTKRMKKGIYRGVMLIGIGYLLRVSIFEWLSGYFSPYFLIVDVLQIIGLSLIGIVLLYLICFKNTLALSILCFSLGCLIFVTDPLYRGIVLEHIPTVLSNYISKANGSVFTFLPWFGYICFGAYIACVFNKYLDKPRFKPIILSLFFLIGYFLIEWSSFALVNISDYTGFDIFKKSAYFNYLFTRLGNVLIYFGIFYGLENFLKTPLILKIGQKTLSIYVIHFIIMYGSFTGYGLNSIIRRTLNPWEAIFGAVLFLVGVCIISFNYVKTNAYIYRKIRGIIEHVKAKT